MRISFCQMFLHNLSMLVSVAQQWSHDNCFSCLFADFAPTCYIYSFGCLFLFVDYRLEGHLIKEKDVSSDLECAHLCLAESKSCPPCKSVNVEKKEGVTSERKCQLNNETDENVKPQSIVPDVAFNILKWAKVSYSLTSQFIRAGKETYNLWQNIVSSFVESFWINILIMFVRNAGYIKPY